MLCKNSIFGIIFAGIAFLPPAYSEPGFPRHPLCELKEAKSQEINKFEAAFRSEFCKNLTSSSCNDRWNNGKLFLKKALADTRITDVGTISYMFGTIYAETGVKNFSPSTTEVIGNKNRNEGYVKEGFYGRGWVQLTHKHKYEVASKALHKNFLKNPDLALDPDNAYEILFRGMNDGWIEVYRSSINGAVAREVPIKLGDFVSSKEINYDLARAVINANCKKVSGKCAPPNIEYRKGLFIPPAESLNAGSKAAMAAEKMEHILCQTSVGKK